MMKRILPIIGLTAVAVVFLATTYHTITVDGNLGEWNSLDEVFSTSTSGVTWFITWDANYLYLGTAGGNKFQGHIVYIDTDPQPAPNQTSGTGTTTGLNFDSHTPTLPFSANFFAYYKVDYSDFRRWTGSAWSDRLESIDNYFATGSDDGEARIPWRDITGAGKPDHIYMLCYITSSDGYQYGITPNDAQTDGFGNKTYSHYWGFIVTSDVSPNALENRDRSLPAQFVSLVAITGNSKVTLVWETGSEFNNAGFEIYRKAQDETDFKYIAGYQTNPELRGLGTSSHGKRYTYTDENVKGGATYVYKIYAVDFNGNRQEFGSITANVVAEIPNKYVLYQNYPNPFNPGTEIRFDLQKSGNVKLEIFNSLGERVAVLYDGFMEAGYGKVVRWNANGFPSGVYYYRLTADGFVDVKKMVLMK
jgi:hypothetical protein